MARRLHREFLAGFSGDLAIDLMLAQGRARRGRAAAAGPAQPGGGSPPDSAGRAS